MATIPSFPSSDALKLRSGLNAECWERNIIHTRHNQTNTHSHRLLERHSFLASRFQLNWRRRRWGRLLLLLLSIQILIPESNNSLTLLRWWWATHLYQYCRAYGTPVFIQYIHVQRTYLHCYGCPFYVLSWYCPHGITWKVGLKCLWERYWHSFTVSQLHEIRKSPEEQLEGNSPGG